MENHSTWLDQSNNQALNPRIVAGPPASQYMALEMRRWTDRPKYNTALRSCSQPTWLLVHEPFQNSQAQLRDLKYRLTKGKVKMLNFAVSLVASCWYY